MKTKTEKLYECEGIAFDALTEKEFEFKTFVRGIDDNDAYLRFQKWTSEVQIDPESYDISEFKNFIL